MEQLKISRRAAVMGVGLTAAWAASPARALLKDLAGERPTLPARLESLIGQMTLEEKAGQLTLMAAAWSGSAATQLNPPSANKGFDAQVEAARQGRLTGVFNGNGSRMARIMQSAVMNHSRLKVPLIFAADVIHGFRTVFPVPLGEAASFDADLAMRTARAAAIEASAAGIDWTFAPMVDIARDARWGRGVEGAGEDVLLGTVMAAARVKGFQGSSLSRNDSVLACAKHFAAYGAAESGLDYNTVDISERQLRQVYLPPFEAAIDAGVLSVMAAFNEINGIPATANPMLMQDILRGEWHFDGFVVSDYTGDEELIAHGFAADARDATRLAFMAGVDMSMQSGLYAEHLPDLVRSGEVPEDRLDQSVRQVLAIKERLGLFDDPFRRIDPSREKARVRTPEMLTLAREAGRKAIVLLKNDGALLPLPKAGMKIALIGPFAAGQHDLVGPWNVYGNDAYAVDLATGMRKAMRDPSQLSVTEGCKPVAAIEGGIAQAVAAAQTADVIVLAIGETTDMSGEAQSRAAIVVPEPQQALAEALAQTGKPMVVILKNGRALELDGAVRDAPAILVSWFLGSQSGPATADVLFGDYSPSARLPVSFPQKSGQEPYYYAHKSTGRPNPAGPLLPFKAHFRGISNSALYPFGHGLTYGEIGYADLQVNSQTMEWDAPITIRATIANSGKRAAEEVVQLYIHDRAASITRPVRQLRAYRKIALAPGQSKTVEFSLKRQDLLFIGQDMTPVVEPGVFDLWVAPSAESEGLHTTFTLKRP